MVSCLVVVLPLSILLMSTVTACSSTVIRDNTKNPTLSSSSNISMSIESNYHPNPGPYTVGVVDHLTLTTATKRQMPLKIYYPEGKGVFPVIIFSHGAGASKDSFEDLGRFWASYGYISIHPTHADSLSLRKDNASLREILTTMLRDSQGWVERVKDISLIVDSLDNLVNQAPELQGKINREQIGVGGHSYGAYTAQLIGGATIDLPRGAKQQSLIDPRVKSVLLLSPQGAGQQGLTDNSWSGFKKPMMVMTGSRDQGAQGQGPDWKREPFDFAPPGDKYLVFIENADHFSFSGRQVGGNNQGIGNRRFGGGRWRDRMNKNEATVNQDPIFDYVKMASLAFWDAYLKNESSAKTYLKSDSLPQYSQGNITISTK
jgi:predicted dienelactone hydrolase